MGKILEVERLGGQKVKIEILEEGRIVNNRYERRGRVVIHQGLVNETYAISPEVAMRGYKIEGEILEALIKANDGKLDGDE